jgi:membrane protease subunit HflK
MNWDWDKLKQRQQKKDGGGGGIPPQMDKYINKFKEFKLPGMPLLVLIFIILFFSTSTFYTVAVDEVGVVQRFGKYVRTSQPGLNFKFPSGIEKVTKVKVRRVYKEEFGFISVKVQLLPSC